jgi:hypothetical protein
MFISLYAEFRAKGEHQWNMLGTDSITDDFKEFILGDHGDWTDSDRFYSFDTFDTKTLSEGMKKQVSSNSAEADPDKVRVLDLEIYEARLNERIGDHRKRIQTTLVALGMMAGFDEYGYLDVADNWRIDDECSAKMRENRKAGQLTFPVSKELINDIVYEDSEYSRALENKGILEAIRGLVHNLNPRLYEENLLEIRLVVAKFG